MAVSELKRREQALQAELQDVRKRRTFAAKEEHDILERLKKLRKKIDKATPKELFVTDHALIQYMRRALGLDIEEFKKQIREPIEAQVRVLGNGKFPLIKGELQAVVKNNKVVTID